MKGEGAHYETIEYVCKEHKLSDRQFDAEGNVAFGIHEYIDIHVENDKIILEPQVLVPKDQAYFYTPEWQQDEANAQKDIEKKRVTRTKNLKELFKKIDE